MTVDVLAQGREPVRPPRERPRLRELALLLAAGLLVAAAASQLGGEDDGTGTAPVAGEFLPPLPRVLLTRAEVVTGQEGADGALQLRVRVEGVPGAQLLSLRAELPGSAVVLGPLPDRLSPQGVAELHLDVLPTCPQALPGLTQAAVVAAVRGREGAAVRVVRVRLDTAGPLAESVRDRCGAVAGAPQLRTSLVELADAPVPDALSTQVELSSAGSEPVTVVAVHAGPGLAVDVTTPLPLVLLPSIPPARLRVALRPDGCGGAPDTPPYVLLLSSGQTVALTAGASVRPHLDTLRPYVCAG